MAVTKITGAGLGLPNADGNALGGASNEWSDLYLADSSVIYFGADQDITLTHAADTGLTTNGTFQATTITATTAVVPDASDGAALGTTSLEWSDLYLADGAVLGFGDDQDVTLTHVADTGLLLNSTMAIQFNDASQYINAPSNAILDINATDEIELNATLVDINANVEISGTATVSSTLGVTGATTLGTNSSGNYALTINPVGDQSNALNFKLSGDTASQYEAMSWKNNSGTVVANIWKTGDPATTAPLRINSAGTIELRSEEVGIDGDAPIVKVGGGIGSHDGYMEINDRLQVKQATPASVGAGTEHSILGRNDNVIGSISSRTFVLALPSITSAATMATFTPSTSSGAWGDMALTINYCGGHTGGQGDGFVTQRVFAIQVSDGAPTVSTAVAGTSHDTAPAVTATASGNTILLQVASSNGSNAMSGGMLDFTFRTHTTAGAATTWTVT